MREKVHCSKKTALLRLVVRGVPGDVSNFCLALSMIYKNKIWKIIKQLKVSKGLNIFLSLRLLFFPLFLVVVHFKFVFSKLMLMGQSSREEARLPVEGQLEIVWTSGWRASLSIWDHVLFWELNWWEFYLGWSWPGKKILGIQYGWRVIMLLWTSLF